MQNVGLSILQAMNRYDSRARVYFCTGLLNLFLAIPLAIRFGGIGCAFATGLSMFLGNGVVMNWFYKKHIGLDIPGFWRQIGRITVPVLICLGMWAMSGLSEWGKCCLLERYWGTRYCMVL
ncbi:polysaccharide biosynthesis C-terminal domain-containing protein [Acidaminococcus fermentans DSM 20731]|nr:polysaccharide biosynthesis C-terminal domain-containing protein [Acidaminococcus fermentans DSM 20731]